MRRRTTNEAKRHKAHPEQAASHMGGEINAAATAIAAMGVSSSINSTHTHSTAPLHGSAGSIMAGPEESEVAAAPAAADAPAASGDESGSSLPPSPVQPGQDETGVAGASGASQPADTKRSGAAAASETASTASSSSTTAAAGSSSLKALRAARCYAPLPFQLKRLFFSASAGDVQMGGRLLRLAHRDPHVYVIDDFLAESDYDYFERLIDQQYGKFRASYTDDSAGGAQFVTESRTSAFICLRKAGDTKLRAVEGRAAEMVGLTPECVEPLQVRRVYARARCLLMT